MASCTRSARGPRPYDGTHACPRRRLILSSAWVVLAVGGPSGIVYALLFALATIPGLPLGFALFGRRHAAGWIAGTLFGYALTALGVLGDCVPGCGVASRVHPGMGRSLRLDLDRHRCNPWPGRPTPRRSSGVGPGRHGRSSSRATPGSGSGRPALFENRRRGRGWQSPLPRLLHRRFRLAHGAGRRDDEAHASAAESISCFRAGALLLDLLPGAGDAREPRQSECRASAGTERLLRRPALHLGDLSRGVGCRARASVRGRTRRDADDRRRERGRAGGHRRSGPPRTVARRAARAQHRRDFVVGVQGPANRQPATRHVVYATARDWPARSACFRFRSQSGGASGRVRARSHWREPRLRRRWRSTRCSAPRSRRSTVSRSSSTLRARAPAAAGSAATPSPPGWYSPRSAGAS